MPAGRRPLGVTGPRLTLLVVCVVAVNFIVGFYGKSVDVYRISQRAAGVQLEIAALEERNRELQGRVTYLQSDAYVETAARERLNLVRPGERAVVVLQARDGAIGPQGPPGRQKSPAGQGAAGAFPALDSFGHLQEWVALFFGPP